jgi:hypothetical protein
MTTTTFNIASIVKILGARLGMETLPGM